MTVQNGGDWQRQRRSTMSYRVGPAGSKAETVMYHYIYEGRLLGGGSQPSFAGL